METTPHKLKYRPEVDGLRAVAVLAVLFYHLAASKLSGGYVGVDIFFVISGFLITSLIWNDLESGKFSFTHFWERRARRIAPALVALILVVLGVGYFVLLPGDFKELGIAAASQATFTANFHYWQSLDYFTGTGDTIPLLHTWSLAVEEQFYLFVPFLFWFFYRFQRFRNRTTVFGLLLLGFVASFAFSIYSVAHYPQAAFYLLPTRAWELLFGALVGFAPKVPGLLDGRKVREFTSFIGFVCICISIYFYDDATPFPGLAAFLPCVGTALVIWSCGYGKTVIGSLLSIRPVVFVGLISYSLYLWHWPVIVFHRYALISWTDPRTRHLLYLAILVETFAFAILSWWFVETPFRVRKIGTTRKRMYAYAGSGLLLLMALGTTLFVTEGMPSRFSDQSLEYANAAEDRRYEGMSLENIRKKHFIQVGVDDPDAVPTIFVWGDSFGGAALPAVDNYLKEKGFVGQAAIYSGTAPLLDYYSYTPWGLNQQALEYNKKIFSYIKDKKIPNVLITACWNLYNSKPAEKEAFRAAFRDTVQKFMDNDIQVFLLLEPPPAKFHIPKFLALTNHFGMDITPYLSKVTAWDQMSALAPNFIADLEKQGVHILDPRPAFVDETGEHFIVTEEGKSLYLDTCHLTDTGSNRKLLPMLRKSLKLSPTPLKTSQKSKPDVSLSGSAWQSRDSARALSSRN